MTTTKAGRPPAESAAVETAHQMLDDWAQQHTQVTRAVQAEVTRLQQERASHDDRTGRTGG